MSALEMAVCLCTVLNTPVQFVSSKISFSWSGKSVEQFVTRSRAIPVPSDAVRLKRGLGVATHSNQATGRVWNCIEMFLFYVDRVTGVELFVMLVETMNVLLWCESAKTDQWLDLNQLKWIDICNDICTMSCGYDCCKKSAAVPDSLISVLWAISAALCSPETVLS